MPAKAGSEGERARDLSLEDENMKKLIFVIFISLLLVGSVGLSANAGVIAPKLESALQSLGPDEEVPVIVTLSDKVNLKLFKDKDKGLRRTRLINALMTKADTTQKPLKAFLQVQLSKLWSRSQIKREEKAD